MEQNILDRAQQRFELQAAADCDRYWRFLRNVAAGEKVAEQEALFALEYRGGDRGRLDSDLAIVKKRLELKEALSSWDQDKSNSAIARAQSEIQKITAEIDEFEAPRLERIGALEFKIKGIREKDKAAIDAAERLAETCPDEHLNQWQAELTAAHDDTAHKLQLARAREEEAARLNVEPAIMQERQADVADLSTKLESIAADLKGVKQQMIAW